MIHYFSSIRQNGEKIVSSMNGIRKTGYLHAKELNLTLKPFTNISSTEPFQRKKSKWLKNTQKNFHYPWP
jgi:hypothetical protein